MQPTCPICGGKYIRVRNSTYSTCVAYQSPPGHNHDDNCRYRTYYCANGHTVKVSKRNSCPVCDWKGTLRCFCDGEYDKVDEWPELPALKPTAEGQHL